MASIEVWCVHEPSEIFFRVHRPVHDPTSIHVGTEFSQQTPLENWECLPVDGAQLIQALAQVLPWPDDCVKVYWDEARGRDVLAVLIWGETGWDEVFPLVVQTLKNWVNFMPPDSDEPLYTQVRVGEECHEHAIHWLQVQVDALV